MNAVTLCNCRCHHGSIITYAVDVRDPVEAVTACSGCLNAHTPALVCPEWPIVPRINPLLTPWVDQGEGSE